MNKREMMSRYYDEREMHSAELSLKFGIEDGTIKLNGNEISGNTYGARLAIKSYFSASWDKAKKVWTINSNMEFAEKIFSDGLNVY